MANMKRALCEALSPGWLGHTRRSKVDLVEIVQLKCPISHQTTVASASSSA